MDSKQHKNQKLAGLSQLNRIKKLAQKRGTPLVTVDFGKKSIRFQYKSGMGVIGFSYSSVLQGITGELRRLAK